MCVCVCVCVLGAGEMIQPFLLRGEGSKIINYEREGGGEITVLHKTYVRYFQLYISKEADASWVHLKAYIQPVDN